MLNASKKKSHFKVGIINKCYLLQYQYDHLHQYTFNKIYKYLSLVKMEFIQNKIRV